MKSSKLNIHNIDGLLVIPSIFFLLLTLPVHAQTADSDLRATIMQYFESTDDDASSIQQVYERVLDLQKHPLNINTADHDALVSLPTVSLPTANALLAYRSKYGRFQSVAELSVVPGIEPDHARLLATMLYVEGDDDDKWYSPQRLKNILKQASHDITLTAYIPTYYRAGDRNAPTTIQGETNKYAGRYLGDPTAHSLRYSMSLGHNLQFNLTGRKTAAEPFFSNGNNMGYDAYAFNLSATDIGRVRHIIVGQYNAQMGMGLVLNNGLSFGKQAMLLSAGRLSSTISNHNSPYDNHYLQGLAASVQLGRFNLLAMLSSRYIDATLNTDSTISTITTAGYHRTDSEMKKKNNATISTAALHLSYSHTTNRGINYSLGLSALGYTTSLPINPVYSKKGTVSRSRLYRLYSPTGSSFYNLSVDYRLVTKSLTLTGETAINDAGALATINTVSMEMARNLTMYLNQRYYDYRYYSLYASAISEGGKVQNESAATLGLRWSPRYGLTFDFYSDIAYFPWYRYRISPATYAFDNSLQASYKRGSWTLSARYRLKYSQKDMTLPDSTKAVADVYTHRLRLTATHKSHAWQTRTQMEGIMNSARSRGMIISQGATCRPLSWMSVYANAAFFLTDDYDSRVYSYEQGMLYSFGSTSFYGRGMRLGLMLTARPSRRMEFRAKAGHTRYFDRESIGSAERTIFSSYATDLDVQAAFRF